MKVNGTHQTRSDVVSRCRKQGWGSIGSNQFPSDFLCILSKNEEGRTYTHHDVRAAPFTYSTETPIFNYLIIHKFNWTLCIWNKRIKIFFLLKIFLLRIDTGCPESCWTRYDGKVIAYGATQNNNIFLSFCSFVEKYKRVISVNTVNRIFFFCTMSKLFMMVGVYVCSM